MVLIILSRGTKITLSSLVDGEKFSIQNILITLDSKRNPAHTGAKSHSTNQYIGPSEVESY